MTTVHGRRDKRTQQQANTNRPARQVRPAAGTRRERAAVADPEALRQAVLPTDNSILADIQDTYE